MGQFFHPHVCLTWKFQINATDVKTSLFFLFLLFFVVFLCLLENAKFNNYLNLKKMLGSC